MGTGQQHNDLFPNPSRKVVSGEVSYDIHFLMCRFNDSFGKMLATRTFSPHEAKEWDSRLERLYEISKLCEEEAARKNKAEFDEKWRGILADLGMQAPKRLK